jgi:hypothetical protein
VANADVQRLDPEAHGELGLRPDLTLSFACGYNLVPLTASEFGPACVWYPILFVGESAPRPVAVTGVPPGPNLFVDAAGAWRFGAYVPAAVRRFPFALAFEGDDEAPQLCVQHPQDVLLAGGRALFADGRPTPLAAGALEFCNNLLAGEADTARFVAELRRLDLLAPRKLTVSSTGGENHDLAFTVIDEARLRALDDATFAEWRRRGWAEAAWAHLASAANWQKITLLANPREASPAPAETRLAS